MPATAGRVRMPANNRVHSSAALQTHGIWQSAIGYDPYAPNKDDSNKSSQAKSSTSELDVDNAYASFQGLLALARITGSNADEARGACKKCGRVGHLTFQCRNFLSLKEEKEKDPVALEDAVASGLDKLKANGGAKMGNKAGVESSEESSEEEESDDSDSEVDSEIERVVAARSRKKISGKSKSSSKKKKRTSDDDESDSGDRKKRVRSKKRRSRKRAGSDSDDEEEVDRKRRKDRSRRRNESSEEDDERHHRHRKSRKEKRRRRSQKHSDYSDGSEESDSRRHKRKSRRAASSSDSDVSSSDDSRVGRGIKRSEKKNRQHHCEREGVMKL